MPEITPGNIEAIRSEGLTAFLRLAQRDGELGIKAGGTAAADIVERGKDSAVFKGIQGMRDALHGVLILTISAPRGQYLITPRLSEVKELIRQNRPREALGKLNKIRCDFLVIVDHQVSEPKKPEIRQGVNEKFDRMIGMIEAIQMSGDKALAAVVFDLLIGLGEEVQSYLTAAIFEDATHLPTDRIQVDPDKKGLIDIIEELRTLGRHKIDILPQQDGKAMVVASGYPGLIEKTGTIPEVSMGFSDLMAVMMAKAGGCLILLKQSGAILQTNPKLLPQGFDPHKIHIMPIRQAREMAGIIGDQIQVVQPMALELAEKNRVTMLVVDEQDPRGGTLVLPNDVFDCYHAQSSDKDHNLPMMGVASDAFQISARFSSPSNETRRQEAIRELRSRILDTRAKIARIDSTEEGVRLIVNGLKKEDLVRILEPIHDVSGKPEVSNKSFVLGISGIDISDFGELKIALESILPDAKMFREKNEAGLFSFGLIVPEIDDKTTRENKLQEVMQVLNRFTENE